MFSQSQGFSKDFFKIEFSHKHKVLLLRFFCCEVHHIVRFLLPLSFLDHSCYADQEK